MKSGTRVRLLRNEFDDESLPASKSQFKPGKTGKVVGKHLGYILVTLDESTYKSARGANEWHFLPSEVEAI